MLRGSWRRRQAVGFEEDRILWEQVDVRCGNVQVDNLAFLVLHDVILVEKLISIFSLYWRPQD